MELVPLKQSLARDGGRHNLVLFGIGNSGTTPAVQMAHRLGWHPADADETYGESVSLRSINERILRGEVIPQSEFQEYLARLPQPWAIKDPRLVMTLEHWQPYLTEHNAALIWIARSPTAVIESRRKRGAQAVRGGPSYAEAYLRVDAGFRNWKGPKLRLDFERIAEAAAIIDPGRATAKRIPSERVVDLASYIPGWMTLRELAWLHQEAGKLSPGAVWVELGTYAGRSLFATAQGLPDGAKLVSVERAPAPELPATVDSIQTARPDIELKMLEMESAHAAIHFDDETVDVVFVDADHSTDAVRDDVRAWWPKMKPGGRIAGHDFNLKTVRDGINAAGLSDVRPCGNLWWAWKPGR